MNRKWNDAQIQYIKDNVATMNDKDLTRALSIKFDKNFTLSATRKQRQRLKLKKMGYRGFSKLI